MIKILFIHYQLVCGGAEQALYDLLCLLDKKKFDITVLAQQEGGLWEQKFRDAGIRIIYYHSNQIPSKNPLIKARNLIYRRKTAAALQSDRSYIIDQCFDEHYDIIVSYFVWKWMGTGLSKKAKTIYYIHGDASTNQSFGDRLKKRQELLAQFNRVVCVSQKAKQAFIEATGITDGVHAFFNPLNSDNVQRLATEPLDLPTDLPIICAVGRLAPEKGFDRLIFIHKRLLDRGIRHRLVIVGDGEEKSHLSSIVRGTQTSDTVLLAGYTPNPFAYMKHSRFLVCSSHTEGLGGIGMEALSLGIPIVSSAPTFRELFGNEPCGVITDPDDDSLEAGIEKMLTDATFYRQAKAAAERRSSFFNGQRMVRDIEHLFTELLQEA